MTDGHPQKKQINYINNSYKETLIILYAEELSGRM